MWSPVFEPELESVKHIIEAVCPNAEEQEYLDVLALENPDEHVEDIIKHFYTEQTEISEEFLQLFLKSPFYVSWHTDPNGLEYRVVVIDNRGVAALYKSLTDLIVEE